MRPKNSLYNTANLRLSVRSYEKHENKHRANIGLDTFKRDWNALSQMTAESSVPKRIWLFWAQGEKNMPPLETFAIKSWRQMNPDWSIICLDNESVWSYIDAIDFPPWLSVAHQSDIIRLALLEKHGGLWADATTICLQPVDNWIGPASQTGVFAFRWPQVARHVANWFIAADPGNDLVANWLYWSKKYALTTFAKPTSYTWVHFVLVWLISKDFVLARLWDQVPHLSARGPQIVTRLIKGDLGPNEIPANQDLEGLPLIKINRRVCTDPDIVSSKLNELGLFFD